ncbi:phospholipid phosphatase 3-like isoform X3 [Eriocheir sinensis]|uniref:phospholipid phosphatase 3-like isoform X3 n=1 Tax=Eriocheir sinensis TaxID=95602 RepID=UPI0021C5734B|nr:phospholipid phosphatase 3-like isoform X3 [Eriocheir sinensis]
MSMMEAKYVVRVVTDFMLLLTVGGCIFVVKKVWSPFERGMFCNDKSISYPFTDHETISDTVLLLFGVAMPAVLMILLEGWRAKHNPVGKPVRVCNRHAPSWMWACYTTIGVFLFGCACSQLTTDIAKYSVGRLRPHFVSICKPDWSKIDCNQTYVDPIPCTSEDSHRLKEARLSFPSGHASFSAFTMVYLVIYLQMRFRFKSPRLLRPFLQFVFLMMTFYTCLSRISDYKHHWSDVLFGFFLGTTVAILISVFVSDLFCGSADRGQLQRQCGDTIQLQECSRSSSPDKTRFV